MAKEDIEPTQQSLERIQAFDVASLPRLERLGEALNFLEAVEPASRLVALFRQFPSQYLGELSETHLSKLKSAADATYSRLEEIVTFDPKTAQDPYSLRTSLISKLESSYDTTFDQVAPLIAYGASRLRDFSALEAEARSSMQASKDLAAKTSEDLRSLREEADRILSDVRKVALEQGVAQQATYFKDESDRHDADAATWRWQTIYVAVGLATFAVLSTFLHKIPWLADGGPYAMAQLAISKVLVFGVIAYMLFLAARNFLSHKHNAIINRHRYNALLTFTALADAAKSEERRDVVLNYAAACIFAPQDTGYTKGGGAPDLPTGLVASIPKMATSAP
ncbi:hypothetical protein [Flaviflagellibacter deserti]|uniref:Uncharacterized protein n=1 Tax=Flaviflagellibacter deserti TaxID=2267266 RepID=A0ABV9YYQ0_9HYPH